MKPNFQNLFGLAITALIFSACNNAGPFDPVEPPKADAEGIKTMFEEERENAKQRFIIDNQAGETIVGAKGTRIEFEANAFIDKNNQVVQGEIDFELIEIYDKADMARMNVPTLAKYGSGTRLLESGGEFYLNATKNGEELSMQNTAWYKMTAPFDGDGNENMQFFTGEEIEDEFLWAIDSAYVNKLLNSYEVYSNKLNWVNIDVFDSAPTTEMKISLPNGLTPLNSVTQLYFHDLTSMLKLYDYQNGQFKANIPEGEELTIITMAVINDQLHARFNEVTVTENLEVEVEGLEPFDAEQLRARIEMLP